MNRCKSDFDELSRVVPHPWPILFSASPRLRGESPRPSSVKVIIRIRPESRRPRGRRRFRRLLPRHLRKNLLRFANQIEAPGDADQILFRHRPIRNLQRNPC